MKVKITDNTNQYTKQELEKISQEVQRKFENYMKERTLEEEAEYKREDRNEKDWEEYLDNYRDEE